MKHKLMRTSTYSHMPNSIMEEKITMHLGKLSFRIRTLNNKLVENVEN